MRPTRAMSAMRVAAPTTRIVNWPVKRIADEPPVICSGMARATGDSNDVGIAFITPG